MCVCVWTIWRDVKLLYFYIGVSEPFGDSWCLTTWTYRWFLVSHPMNPLVIPGVSPPEPIGDSWCLTIWTCGDSWCLASTAGGSESHAIHCPTKTVVWDCVNVPAIWIFRWFLVSHRVNLSVIPGVSPLEPSVIPGVSPFEPFGDS